MLNKTKRLSLLLGALISLTSAPVVLSADADSKVVVNASVDSQKVLKQIDEKIYSQFLEHIYNSCNGGLWGELVWNRSLEAGRENGWVIEDGLVKQESRSADCRLLLGKDSQGQQPWTDYEFRVKAKKIAGNEGFLIIFRAAPDMSSYYWVNIGGWGNECIAIEKETKKSRGRHVIGPRTQIKGIADGEVCDIRLVVVGQKIQVFINDECVHEIEDTSDDVITSGCVGVGTWETKAEFGDILVRDLQNKPLYDMTKDAPSIFSTVDVRYWTVKGSASTRRGDALNSSRYLRFSGQGQLMQNELAFNQEETYDYSYWTRGKGKVEFSCNVGASENEKIGDYKADSDDWTKVTGSFTVSESSVESSICLSFVPEAGSFIDVDQVSIMPRSWKENSEGFRPDLLKAVADIHPSLIRWPGGCYASAYRWKSGIGPQDKRGAYPIELWNDVDVNSFGIDEFVPFCRSVGAEPIMVVNIGTAQWINAVGDPALKSNDWLQEVCDWVEYCNGPATSKWGAVRAQNGHPDPYNVKYWEIDNEVRYTDTPASKYVAIINELVPRIKAIDPNVKIIACGSWMGDKMRWDEDVVKGAGKNFDYLSLHRYDDPNGFAFNPWDNQRFYEAHREMIAKSDNPNIKLFSSEWNAQSTDWRTGLHAGGYLNCCERVADVMEIAAPALFLRHKTATGWDNAFINFDNARWYPAPNYVVMKLWRDSFAPNLLDMSSEAPELNGDNPIINAVATKSEDGKTLYFKTVNCMANDVTYNVAFDDVIDVSKASISATCVTPEVSDSEDAKAKLAKRNTLDDPHAIAPFEIPVRVDNNVVSVDAPSYSALVIKIELN